MKLLTIIFAALVLSACQSKQNERLIRIPLSSIAPGIVLVEVPSGQFSMGCNSGDTECLKAENPSHTVNVEAFSISATEITFAQYDLFAVDTDRPLPDDEGWGRENRPVINVFWDDVVAYTEWLSAKTGQHFRLPTEAEWEYAARAGTSSKYNFGDSIDCLKTNYDGAKCPERRVDDSLKGTMPVGSYGSNAFGLYDTHGNVSEWTLDCWTDDYSNSPNDGTANYSGDCEVRITRGGSWSADAKAVRTTDRSFEIRHATDKTVGFRILLDESKPEQSSKR
ncbi:MAG: formylglycine-generating enzyme family protein [Gammaproteobacteria bacterium]|nr:formylglycine-generating enzyme family protein [Gammaproteobacteria bacterium]